MSVFLFHPSAAFRRIEYRSVGREADGEGGTGGDAPLAAGAPMGKRRARPLGNRARRFAPAPAEGLQLLPIREYGHEPNPGPPLAVKKEIAPSHGAKAGKAGGLFMGVTPREGATVRERAVGA